MSAKTRREAVALATGEPPAVDGIKQPDLPPPVNFLSPHGELLAEAPMPDELALRGYRTMLLGRRFDDRCISLQRQGRMVTLAPCTGQEAATVGAAMALDPSTDWYVPQYRELAGQLWHGYPLRLAFLWHTGHPIGFEMPEGLKMLPFQAAIAGQIPQAVGLAWALSLKGDPGVVATFFGDGGTSEGDFHEAANLAGVVKAPIVMVCQNNGWAISTPVEKQTASPTLAQKALAYGMTGVQCDGNDLFAVFATVKAAVERARRGEGPTLVEALTYRLGLHTTADDPTRYVPADEPPKWVEKDPLLRLGKYLVARGATTEAGLEQMEAEVKDELAQAWAEAQKEPAPDPRHYFSKVTAEPDARLKRQLDELYGPA
jgi:pyruvate dehydrogenase E1 component alpha subunit